MADAEKTGSLRIPVEVVAKDGKAKWVMVEVPAEPTSEESRF